MMKLHTRPLLSQDRNDLERVSSPFYPRRAASSFVTPPVPGPAPSAAQLERISVSRGTSLSTALAQHRPHTFRTHMTTWTSVETEGSSCSPAFHRIDSRTSCTWGSWAEWASQLCPLWTLPEGWSSRSPKNTEAKQPHWWLHAFNTFTFLPLQQGRGFRFVCLLMQSKDSEISALFILLHLPH